MNKYLTGWTKNQLFTALNYSIDQLIDERSGLREELPDIQNEIVNYINEQSSVKIDKIDDLPEPDDTFLKFIIEELEKNKNTYEVVSKWFETPPDDRTMGFDPVSSAVLVSAIYFILTIDFEISVETEKGKKKKSVKKKFKISRSKGVPSGLLNKILQWIQAG